MRMNMNNRYCSYCGETVPKARWDLGIHVCMLCGEEIAQLQRASWCVAPMHKSSYMLITDPTLLVGLNNKGGLVK
jgi:ribosomal protein L37AE/L43A